MKKVDLNRKKTIASKVLKTIIGGPGSRGDMGSENPPPPPPPGVSG